MISCPSHVETRRPTLPAMRFAANAVRAGAARERRPYPRTMTTPAPVPVTPSSSSRGALVLFWVLAVAGAAVMFVAWGWMATSWIDEILEEPRARAAGTTVQGTAMVVGGVPLVIAHLLGFTVLVPAARSAGASRGRAFGYAGAAIGVASLIGVLTAQFLMGSQPFVEPVFIP